MVCCGSFKVRSGVGLILRTSSGPSSRTDDTVIGAGHHVVLAKGMSSSAIAKKARARTAEGAAAGVAAGAVPHPEPP